MCFSLSGQAKGHCMVDASCFKDYRKSFQLPYVVSVRARAIYRGSGEHVQCPPELHTPNLTVSQHTWYGLV